MNYLGNRDILKLKKIAFLCSRRVPAEAILKSYDWAKEQRKAGNCIICSNHSPIEKDVFEILLKGTQPLILVLPRAIKNRWEPGITEAIAANRLLIISPFEEDVKRVTRETAQRKNEVILSIADEVEVGFATPGGQLDKLIIENHNQIKFKL